MECSINRNNISINWRTDSNALLVSLEENCLKVGKAYEKGCFEGSAEDTSSNKPAEKKIKTVLLTKSDCSQEINRGQKTLRQVLLASEPIFSVHRSPQTCHENSLPLIPPGSDNQSKPHTLFSEVGLHENEDEKEPSLLMFPRVDTLKEIDDALKCLQITPERSKELIQALRDLEFHPQDVQEIALAYPEALSFHAASKNRYGDVMPKGLDLVRLKFKTSPFTDYINANYFNGMIVTQGPMKNTLADFWMMVWEQGSHIICLTEYQGLSPSKKLVEKTFPYWNPSLAEPPLNKLAEVGMDLLFNEEIGGEGQRKRLTVRPLGFPKHEPAKLELARLEPARPEGDNPSEYFTRQEFEITFGESSKKVTHWFFHHWKDHGKCNVLVLVSLLELLLPLPGLCIIHCSAGIGRAGTFAAIKALLDHFIKTNIIPGEDEILEIISELRKRRPGSIQSKEQLALIFDALSLYIRRSLSAQRLA